MFVVADLECSSGRSEGLFQAGDGLRKTELLATDQDRLGENSSLVPTASAGSDVFPAQ